MHATPCHATFILKSALAQIYDRYYTTSVGIWKRLCVFPVLFRVQAWRAGGQAGKRFPFLDEQRQMGRHFMFSPDKRQVNRGGIFRYSQTNKRQRWTRACSVFPDKQKADGRTHCPVPDKERQTDGWPFSGPPDKQTNKQRQRQREE